MIGPDRIAEVDGAVNEAVGHVWDGDVTTGPGVSGDCERAVVGGVGELG